ncbi:MAG: hypothetical protein FWD71_18415 [Oscillospiraceae bacterium]|nr:hypothetical protein [Oscillospiraceae bacterium]
MKYDKKIIDWLIEDKNPAIKYRTLTEICGKSPAEYKDIYDLIWEQKSIVNMMNRQDENGLWESEKRYYGSFLSLKYLTAFAEHGIQKDTRLDRFVNYTVNILKSSDKNGDLAGCGTPLVLRALVMMGYHDRAEVKELISKFAAAQLYDGGFMCKRLLDRKPERKSCYKAAITGMLLYAECKKKNILPDNSDKLIEYFLKRDVFYSSDKSKAFYDKDGKVGWRFIDNFFPAEPMRIGIHLIVSALSVLGAGNQPAMTEAWKLFKEKENENGILKLEGTLTKQPCSFGTVGKDNKWITFYALLAEKYRML